MRGPVAYMATLPDVGSYDIRAFGATEAEAEALVKKEYLRVKRQGYATKPWPEAKEWHGLQFVPVVLGTVEMC